MDLWILFDGFIPHSIINIPGGVTEQMREKNLGWRIDYLLASQSMAPSIKNASILANIKHSDHCPILLEIN